jgi:hypothetical protein
MTGPEARTGYPAMGYQALGYPLQFSVDYPDRPLNRLTTAFRIILVIRSRSCSPPWPATPSSQNPLRPTG